MELLEPGWSAIRLSPVLWFYSPNPWKNRVNVKLLFDSRAALKLVIGAAGRRQSPGPAPRELLLFRPWNPGRGFPMTWSPGCSAELTLPWQLCDLRLPLPLSEPQFPQLWKGGGVTGIVTFIETESRVVGAGAWGRECGAVVFNGYGISVWVDEKVLKMDPGNGCTWCLDFMPLSCTLKNGQGGNVYSTTIFF